MFSHSFFTQFENDNFLIILLL